MNIITRQNSEDNRFELIDLESENKARPDELRRNRVETAAANARAG